MTTFLKEEEPFDLQIYCHYTDNSSLEILPNFYSIWKTNLNKLTISGCNMNMFSLFKLIMELKPRMLSIGSSNSDRPFTLIPVVHQTNNCIHFPELRDSLNNTVELIYMVDSRSIGGTMETFLNIMFSNMPVLQTLKPPVQIPNYFTMLDKVLISGRWKSSWTEMEKYSITLKDVMTETFETNAKFTPWLLFEWLLFHKNSTEQEHSTDVVDLHNASEIYTEALAAIPVLNHFSFSLGDHIYCGCKYIKQYVMLNLLYNSGYLTNPYYSNNWTCKGPGEFSGMPLLKAPQRMFKDCRQGYPGLPEDNCVRYTDINSNKYTLDCSTCGLKKLPHFNMNEVEVILMTNNQINDLCETSKRQGVGNVYMFPFFIPPTVEVIDLKNNSLQSICDDFFRRFDHSSHIQLKKIDLRQNQLTTLSKYVLTNQFNLDFVILLEGNKFLCTCDNTWLKDWIVLQPNEWLPDLKSVECRDRRGNNFVDMKESEMDCNTRWQNVTIGLATAVGIIVLITMPLYRMRTKIKIWMFLRFGWHPLDKGDNDDDITDMDYDAFISYSHQDRTCVRENLVDFLPELSRFEN